MKKIFSMVIVVLSVLLIGCSGDKKKMEQRQRSQ